MQIPPVKSLREFIRDTLLERIARGGLPPGQRVVEATLVKEFSISATPVREAIRELVAMSVLEAQNNKGASVRQIRLHEMQGTHPVAIAREHLPIVAALDKGDPDLAAALLASHSNQLVGFLQAEQRQREATLAPAQTLRPRAKVNSTNCQPISQE